MKVIQINNDNYKGRFLKSAKTEMWLLEFHAPWCGYCKSFSPTFDNMDNLLRIEQVKVAKIDCEPNKDLCDAFEVVRYPTIKFVREGLLYDYKFKPGTNEGMMAEFVREGFEDVEPTEIPGMVYTHTYIIDIGLENFTKVVGNHDWMLEFYSPECTHSKKFAPTYQRLADKFASNITAGRIDCLQVNELCKLFEIQRYPTVFYLHDEQIWEFDRERSTKNLTKFFQGEYVQYPVEALPTSYGKYQPYIRIAKFYFLGFEYFLTQHIWWAISLTFIYGLLLGCCVLGKPATPVSQKPITTKKVAKQPTTTTVTTAIIATTQKGKESKETAKAKANKKSSSNKKED